MTRVRRNWDNNPRNWYDVTRWCCKELGLPSDIGKWKFETNNDYMDFYFQNPQDAELFILKWM